MEAWQQEALKFSIFVGLLSYMWRENKARVDKAMEDLASALSQKADKASAQDIETRLSKQIDKIEERQIREVEGLRTEMGDMRTHMDRRFDQIIGLLTK